MIIIIHYNYISILLFVLNVLQYFAYRIKNTSSYFKLKTDTSHIFLSFSCSRMKTPVSYIFSVLLQSFYSVEKQIVQLCLCHTLSVNPSQLLLL